jgi:hypothetical protein
MSSQEMYRTRPHNAIAGVVPRRGADLAWPPAVHGLDHQRGRFPAADVATLRMRETAALCTESVLLGVGPEVGGED